MENVPPNEASDIQELKELQLEQMTMEAAQKHAKPMDRGQHPKHHGFLVARFTVADNVPDGTAGRPFPRAEDLHRRDPLLQYRQNTMIGYSTTTEWPSSSSV